MTATLDLGPLGEIGGQHAPLDPAFGHIKDGIEHGPHTQGARSSPAFGGGDHLFDPLPFLIGQGRLDIFFHSYTHSTHPTRTFQTGSNDFQTLFVLTPFS
jgi:hypothetical protein